MPKFIRKHPWFFVWTTVILLVTLALVAGIRSSVDMSIVNQLQHIDQTTRTNDIFDPVIVDDSTGSLEIEVTFPTLTMVPWMPPMPPDLSDIYVHYWRMPNPIESVYDWIDDGVLVDSFALVGAEYDSYCDVPSGIYYTHFYRLWNVPDLLEDYTYVLYLEFWDADGEEYRDEELSEIVWGYTHPLEDEVISIMSDCDYVSFFEYQEFTGGNGGTTTTPTTTIPTTTPTTTPTNGNGGNGIGPIIKWFNGYTIFDGMQNWVFLIILVLILGFLGFIIFIILYFKKKDKKKKK